MFSFGATFPLKTIGMEEKGGDGHTTWDYAMQLGSEYR